MTGKDVIHSFFLILFLIDEHRVFDSALPIFNMCRPKSQVFESIARY